MKRRVALLALAASVALLLSGCLAMDKHVDLIFRVDFSQYQAVPDFDDGKYVIDGYEPELDAFKNLLTHYGIEPWNYAPREAEGCTGGITTTAQVMYHSAGQDTMVINGCAAEEGTFEADATALFAQYRESHHIGDDSLANDQIVALTFSQAQAIEGFDTSEHTQDDPQQVARFVDLLTENGVVWSEGIDPALFGTPCPGSIVTSITAAYSGTDAVVGPVEIGGCGGSEVGSRLTALFTEWREAG